jgi:hypothetical protein
MLRAIAKNLVPSTRALWPFILERMIRMPQPDKPKARIIFTFLTRTGITIDGKLTFFEFFPLFLARLRERGLETRIAFSEASVAQSMEGSTSAVIVNVYGEDHASIRSPKMAAMERDARAVFNPADAGLLLRDKLIYHRAMDKAGVAVPGLVESGGFARERLGSGRPTSLDDQTSDDGEDGSELIRTHFVDTAVAFEGEKYLTTVRLICINERILHAFTRARAASDGNASVHSSNTPLDPNLLEYLHAELVEPHHDAFAQIAAKLHRLIGNGFFVHDLLIERQTGAIMVCESGLKFDDWPYRMRLAKVGDAIPSQAPIMVLKPFAMRSADTFADICETLLANPANGHAD